MESQTCVFLGIKVKPGPIERFKLDNFTLDNTVDRLKTEAEKKANLPSASLELIHHGKILKDNVTLLDSGVKNGEMVHVVKKKVQPTPPPPATYTDAELQQIALSLRTLGCTPNAPGWTRAMQLLNDESAMAEIIEEAPSLADDCVTLSILHEVELLAALGANAQTMRRAADARPDLPAALRCLTRLLRSRSSTNTSIDNVPTSGFAYSLEALSEDEDAEEEENEEGERSTITQEQLAAALQAATEAVSTTSSRGSSGQNLLLRLLGAGESSRDNSSANDPSPSLLQHLLRPADESNRDNSSVNESTPTDSGRSQDDFLLRILGAGESSRDNSSTPTGSAASRSMITPEMFSEAISEAINRSGNRNNSGTPMEQSTAASSSQSPVASSEDFTTQLQHMHEMGLIDDALNVRALLICAGDVNAAINLVFSGAIGDE